MALLQTALRLDGGLGAVPGGVTGGAAVVSRSLDCDGFRRSFIGPIFYEGIGVAEGKRYTRNVRRISGLASIGSNDRHE